MEAGLLGDWAGGGWRGLDLRSGRAPVRVGGMGAGGRVGGGKSETISGT